MVNITARVSQEDYLHESTRAEGIIFRTYTAEIHQGRTRQDGYNAHDWV